MHYVRSPCNRGSLTLRRYFLITNTLKKQIANQTDNGFPFAAGPSKDKKTKGVLTNAKSGFFGFKGWKKSKQIIWCRVFEDCIKRPVTEGEYSTTYYEFHTVEFEVMNASKTYKVGIETREICVTYFIWFKII